MSNKRKSEEPLQDLLAESPASKRARVEDLDGQTNDSRTRTLNGRHSEPLKDATDDSGDDVDGEENDGEENDGEENDGEENDGEENDGEENDGEENDGEENDGENVPVQRLSAPVKGFGDLYLDTVNRTILDFDFEKLCSISLSNINVYACLVCGKYFQGRGPKSHAYFHALDEDHHVYINVETKKVYVLPEGYEVVSKSLDDIRYVVDPRYVEDEVKKLDKIPTVSFDLANKKYRPGFIGMNNIKANDYLNVVIQTLSHVAPVRNYFLLHQFPMTAAQLPVRLSTLVRKIWNPRAFRNHVSPHELIQEIALRSAKRFTLTEQSDPVDFMTWLLNSLHLSLGGSKTKPNSSIIHRTFQGRVRVETQDITARAQVNGDSLRFEESSHIQTNITPFMILTLDLPPVPLFRDSVESKNVIPQVPLTTLLQKYNGLQAFERAMQRVRYRLLHPLPPYLFLFIKRFSANKFVSERNPTIVTFSTPRGLDLSPFVEPNPSIHPPGEPVLYDMIANITLDATTRKGGEDSNAADAANRAVGGEGERVQWKVQLRDKAAAGSKDLPEWREIQDLFVDRAEAETLFTREGYLMVWERRSKPKTTGEAKRRE